MPTDAPQQDPAEPRPYVLLLGEEEMADVPSSAFRDVLPPFGRYDEHARLYVVVAPWDENEIPAHLARRAISLSLTFSERADAESFARAWLERSWRKRPG